MTENKLFGVRDPYGIRPLSLGSWNGHYVLASETCAFDTIGAKTIRDIEPGEMVVIDEEGVRSMQALPLKRKALCIFEFIYFARPDSNMGGRNVHLVRKELGRQLAREHPVDGDIVTGVPDSSLAAASGFAEEMGISYETGMVKNRYIGRTFIQPNQKSRETSVRIKLNALKSSVKGKRVVMIDDSIVRGTTMGRIVRLLRDAGAKEVHVRVSSPPFVWPCYFGTDIPSKKELVACHHSIPDICKRIGADTLGYLSVANLAKITPDSKNGFCSGCFTGQYPVEII